MPLAPSNSATRGPTPRTYITGVSRAGTSWMLNADGADDEARSPRRRMHDPLQKPFLEFHCDGSLTGGRGVYGGMRHNFAMQEGEIGDAQSQSKKFSEGRNRSVGRNTGLRQNPRAGFFASRTLTASRCERPDSTCSDRSRRTG